MKKITFQLLTVIFIGSCIIQLNGCGQKGPLYLPPQETLIYK